jgi:predicted metal-binding protein
MTNWELRALENGADICKKITPEDIVFDPRTRFKCRACGKYGRPHCPPNIPGIVEFGRMIKKYSDVFIVVKKCPYSGVDTFPVVREESGRELHRILLSLERQAISENFPWALSFIGGSCRICKECDPNRPRCNELGRISVEGTGIDVARTLAFAGLILPSFGHPRVDGGEFWRVGLFLLE